MDQTRIQPPIAASAGEPEDVRKNAPTLLGSEVPGSQGEVRVWSPSPWILRSLFVVALGGAIVSAELAGVHVSLSRLSFAGATAHIGLGIYALQLAFAGWACCSLIVQLKRVRSVTTDDAGIAFTHRKGSTALQWEEISEIRSFSATLITDRGKLKPDLGSFASTTRSALLALMAQRAGLYRHPDDYYRLVRREVAESAWNSRKRRGNLRLQQPEPPRHATRPGRIGLASFIAACILMTVLAGAGAWMAWWAYNAQLGAFANMFFPSVTLRDPGVRTRLFAVERHLQPPRKAGRSRRSSAEYRVSAVVDIVQPSPEVATLSCPGWTVGYSAMTWAPLYYLHVDRHLYEYRVEIERRPGAEFPSSFRLRLDYPDRSQFVTVTLPQRPLLPGDAIDRDFYCNSWGEFEREPPAPGSTYEGSVPEADRWTYAAVAAPPLSPRIRSIRFIPSPPLQNGSLSNMPPGAGAAWMPGVKSPECEVVYQNGRAIRFALGSGHPPAGWRVVWQPESAS